MRKLLFSFFTIVLFTAGKAQIDTSFWFVAPKVPAAIGINSVGLQFGAYAQSATITVTQPANPTGVNFTLALPANTSTIVNVTASLSAIASTLANQADNKGIYISSNNLISVNYNISSAVSKESISLKGNNGKGTDFFTPFANTINSINTGTPGNVAFDIVATEPGITTLLITPRGNLLGPRTKNITFATTLTQGQTFSCREDLLKNNIPRSVVAADFNNDLFADIAIIDVQYNLLFVFTNNGAGVFTEVATYTLGLGATKVIAADVNNDSNQDLIVTNSGSNSVSVFLGNGNATFNNGVNFAAGSTPVSVACADINADTDKDLVVVNNGGNNITVLTGNGTGNFAFLANYNVATAPSDIAMADFNADGKPDIAVTNGGSNNVSVLLATVPTGSFGATVNYNVQTNPQALTLGDFNSDSRIDIAVANRNSNSVSILRATMTGTVPTGTFLAAQNNALIGGTGPTAIMTTTINGDANPDLAVANFTSSTVGVMIGSSTGTFSAGGSHIVGVSPASIVFADFNGDGQQDFVTANFNSANYSFLTGNGTATLSPITNNPYGYTIPFPTKLAGSIVSADKKITVTISGAVQTTGSCPSFYTDQITNTSAIGKDHVIHKSNTSADMAYILAPFNSTGLTITSGTVTNLLINTGETYTVNTSNNPVTFVSSDKPVYVFNVAGNSCKIGAAQLAPAYCAGSYTTGFTRESSDSLFLQIYIRSGFQNTFTLEINGTPASIAASSFSVVPGSSNALVFARIYYNTASIPLGAYCILKNSQDLFALSVQNLSSTSGNSFSQVSDFSSKTFVFANTAPTATICSNTTFTLNGVVGGGPSTGVWSLNGFGSLSGGNSQLINNVYTPNPVDTNIKPVKIILTSTGICPNKSDTFKLTVKQAPIVNAGFDVVICSNNPTVQLNGNVIGPTTQGTWSVAAPGSGTFMPGVTNFTATYNLSNTDTAQSSLKIFLTSTNNAGCNAVSDTMKVVINKAPVVTSSTLNPIVRCANNANIFLNGSVSGTTTSTGIWSTTGTGYFSPNNLSLICNYVPSLSDISTGTVSLKLTSTNNAQCREVADSTLVIFTQPVTVSTGVDLNSCKNDPSAALNAVITGTATNSGIWYGGSGNFSPSNSVLSPTYIASASEISNGFVILTFSTTNNGICAGVSDQVRIDFREKPTANYVVNSVCLNQNSVFTDASSNTSGIGSITQWQWFFGDGNVITASTSSSQVNTYTAAGTYTSQLIITSSFNCRDTIQRPVTVFGLPIAGMTFSRSCTGSAQQISFTDQSTIAPPGSISSTGYYWDFGGFGFSVSKDTSIVFPSEGNYNVTHVVTSTNNCVSSITQSVLITQKPKANFIYTNNNTQSIETNIAFTDTSIAAVTWTWDFGNNTTSNIQHPIALYTANGSYTVSLTITDQYGCADTYTAVVKISNIVSEIAQLIPNFISPNNDGKNDLWRLDFINVFYPKAEIEIYNRWGEQLFKSMGYSNAWDGSYKGSPLPVGAYYYIIKLNDPKDEKIYKGTVTLLK